MEAANFGNGVPESFPNQLRCPPGAAPLPRRGLLLAGLLLFCLAIQVWTASRWHVIWPDTVDYLRVSQALDRGDPRPLADQFGLNPYPLVLVLLHRAGLDWLWAGQCWSMAMTGLVVLPLWGWLRRQFDDRVALIGCLLYALHPKLMIHGPLVIRDPTFWFLLVLTLYLGWRAVLELKPWLFCATGVAWALAAFTRTEGLLLAAPLGLWCVFRWPAVAGQRRRLVLGGLLCAAMLPAWVLLMNVTLLRSCPHWVWIRHVHLEMIEAPLAAPETVQAAKAPLAPPAAPALASGTSWRTTVALIPKVAVRIVKAFTYAYLGLTLLGVWLWRGVFFRRDQLAMVPFHALLWTLVGVYLAMGIESDDRYYLPSVILLSGCAALGLLAVAQWLVRLSAARLAWNPPRRAALVGGLLAAFVLIGTHEYSLQKRQWMRQRAELGQWICRRLGPQLRLAGSVRDIRLVSYYAQAEEVPDLDRYPYQGEGLLWTIGQCKPDVLLLWGKENDAEDPPLWRNLLDQHAELGLCRVPAGELPPGCREIKELVVAVRPALLGPRQPAATHAARR